MTIVKVLRPNFFFGDELCEVILSQLEGKAVRKKKSVSFGLQQTNLSLSLIQFNLITICIRTPLERYPLIFEVSSLNSTMLIY